MVGFYAYLYCVTVVLYKLQAHRIMMTVMMTMMMEIPPWVGNQATMVRYLYD